MANTIEKILEHLKNKIKNLEELRKKSALTHTGESVLTSYKHLVIDFEEIINNDVVDKLQENTDLLELIKKSEFDISYYLGEVDVDNFRSDVIKLVRKDIDKEFVQKAIDNLTNLIK